MRLPPAVRQYVEERAEGFVGRDWVFDRVQGFLAGPPGALVLRGVPGAGKTAILARLASTCPDAIAAAAFCRAGRASFLELSQAISEQLAESVDGFGEQLRAGLATEISIGDVRVDAVGAQRVTGVHIDLAALGDERAFCQAVAMPLRRLRDRDAAARIVLVVDALDEAPPVHRINQLSRQLARLVGVHLIVSCRPDPPLLADFRAGQWIDLFADAPAGVDDVRDYVRGRLGASHPLVARIAADANSNFLYAYYRANSVLLGAAAELQTGGLTGVYQDFLDRVIDGDDATWVRHVRPILGPLAVALGDGLTSPQLARAAGIAVSEARDVARRLGQLLEGDAPDGPWRVYHQSFATFLTDAEQNPHWLIDPAECHRAIVTALLDELPLDAQGRRNWDSAAAYTRAHMPTHAMLAGLLDDLLAEAGFLLACRPPALLDVLRQAHAPRARCAARAYRRSAHRLSASYLRLAALQGGAEELAAQLEPADAPWWPVLAWWTPAASNRVIGRLGAHARALAVTETADGPVAVAAGEHGLELWRLDAAEQVAMHPWKVRAAAIADAGPRPLVVAGHVDGTVALHELPSLRVLACNDAAHAGAVLAVTAAGMFAVTGDRDGTVAVWRLPDLELVATRRCHSTVYALACVSQRDGTALLASAGEGGSQLSPVGIWSLPTLKPRAAIDSECGLARKIVAGNGILAFECGNETHAALIGPGGALTPLGVVHPQYPDGLIVASSELLVCAHEAVTRIPLGSGTSEAPTPVGSTFGVQWAGPISVGGRRLLVGAADVLRAWDLDELGPGEAAPEERAVRALAVAGDVLAAVTSQGEIRRWRTLEPLPAVRLRAEPPSALAPCGPLLLVGYADGVVDVLDAATAELRHRLQVAGAVHALAAARDVVAVAVETSRTYSVHLLDVATGVEVAERLRFFGWEDKPISGLACVERDGVLRVAAKNSWELMEWRLDNVGAPITIVDSRADRVAALAGAGGRLAIWRLEGYPAGEIEVWVDAARGRVHAGAHRGGGALAISAWDGPPALLSGGRDGWLRAWTATGGELFAVEIEEPIDALAALPGRRVAVATRRGLLVLELAAHRDGAEPVAARLAELRAALGAEHGLGDWRRWEDTVPSLEPGTATSAIAGLLTGAPREAVRVLVQWLEDKTPLQGLSSGTVADVACGILARVPGVRALSRPSMRR